MNSSEQILVDLNRELDEDKFQSKREYLENLFNTYRSPSPDKSNTHHFSFNENDSQTIYSNELNEMVSNFSNKNLEVFDDISSINSNKIHKEKFILEEGKLGTKSDISLLKITEKKNKKQKCPTYFMPEKEKNKLFKVKKDSATEIVQTKKQESSMNIKKLAPLKHIRKNHQILYDSNNNQSNEKISIRNITDDYHKKSTISCNNLKRSIFSLNKTNEFSSLFKDSMILTKNEKIMDYFETVANFKNYFPENNSKAIFEEFNKMHPSIKYSKILKERTKSLDERLSKYTFFLGRLKEKMPSEINKKVMQVKRHQREMLMSGLKSMIKCKFESKRKSQKNESEIPNEWQKNEFFTEKLISKENKFSDIVKFIMGSTALKKKLKTNLKPMSKN